MTTPIEILCIGHAAWDVFLPMDSYPTEDTKVVTREWSESGGGPASNAAYLLSKWGVPTAYACVVGNDVYGQNLISEFEAIGTDTSLIQVDADAPTPVSVIIVNETSGSRTILNRRKGRKPCVLGDTSQMNPKVLLFDGHELHAALEAMKRFPDAVSILDAGALREASETLARNVDFVVASARFTREVSGIDDVESSTNWDAALNGLRSLCGGEVAFTIGARGVVYGSADAAAHIPAFKVKAIDTTAAGDIFHGAFAYGLLKQMSFEESLRFASAASALSVERPGGRSATPYLNEVHEAIERWTG